MRNRIFKRLPKALPSKEQLLDPAKVTEAFIAKTTADLALAYGGRESSNYTIATMHYARLLGRLTMAEFNEVFRLIVAADTKIGKPTS